MLEPFQVGEVGLWLPECWTVFRYAGRVYRRDARGQWKAGSL